MTSPLIADAPADTNVRHAYAFETLLDVRVRVTGGRAAYIIDPRPRGWTCTCPAFQFAPAAAKGCKHIIACRTSLAARGIEDLAGAIARETEMMFERCEAALGQLAARTATDLIRQAWRRAAAAEQSGRRSGRPLAVR